MQAVFYAKPPVVKVLLEKGAQVNTRDKFGKTALMEAAFSENAGIVKALLAKGANVNARDRFGKTALMVAAFSGSVEIVRALVAKGADVGVRDSFGRTALDEASSDEIRRILKTARRRSQIKMDAAIRPRVIPLDFGVEESAGGLTAADLDGDGRWDFVVTAPGNIGAYGHDGRRLWRRETDIRVSAGSSEAAGLPGHHAPGVQVADVDGDRRAELLYLDQSSTVHIVDAATGKEKRAVRVPHPTGAERWEHLVVANLRGRGDRDLLLQATNKDGYRMGRYVAAYSVETLDGAPLWTTDDYLGCAHNGLRIADLDGDGRDEILGATILGPDGKLLYRLPEYRGHLDSIFVADVRPDLPGLEVIALQEGGPQEVFCYNHKDLIWRSHHKNQEPQNAAVGDFDAARPGREVWCRSRHDTGQKPFVFDSHGSLLAEYALDDVAPAGWTRKGVEVISPIDWTGGRAQLAAAKERHTSEDIGIFEPISGRFVTRFPEKADRIYVADVSGDWREEVLVISDRELHIYENPARNPDPKRPRLWEQPHYRRSKMTWNYYSP